jgi:hypothetical protein
MFHQKCGRCVPPKAIPRRLPRSQWVISDVACALEFLLSLSIQKLVVCWFLHLFKSIAAIFSARIPRSKKFSQARGNSTRHVLNSGNYSILSIRRLFLFSSDFIDGTMTCGLWRRRCTHKVVYSLVCGRQKQVTGCRW